MISYSSPGKVILSGEHAVVYGKPALVSAIDKKLTLSLFSPLEKAGRSKIKNLKEDNNKNIKVIEEIVKKYLSKEKIKFKKRDYFFSLNSEIPIGRGLGSSAAFSVAAASSFLEFYTGKQFSQEIINNLAYEGEKYFHKNPSGVDSTASCFGGLIYFRKEFEFLKNISLLNFKIPKKIEDCLYLIDSGQPEESTSKMVAYVKEKYNKQPNVVEEVFNQIEKTTKRMVVSIIKKDESLFIDSLLNNQSYLEVLDVVSKKTKKLLQDLANFGIGKITGAGGRKKGSGFILFYAKKKNQLEDYLRKKKINFFKFKQDYQGVKKL